MADGTTARLKVCGTIRLVSIAEDPSTSNMVFWDPKALSFWVA